VQAAALGTEAAATSAAATVRILDVCIYVYVYVMHRTTEAQSALAPAATVCVFANVYGLTRVGR